LLECNISRNNHIEKEVAILILPMMIPWKESLLQEIWQFLDFIEWRIPSFG